MSKGSEFHVFESFTIHRAKFKSWAFSPYFSITSQKVTGSEGINTTLKMLDLSHNHLDMGGQFSALKAIGCGLMSNSTLTCLDLSYNNCCHTGVHFIFSALIKNSTLIALDLNHNRLFGSSYSQDLEHLSACLEKNASLRFLKLGGPSYSKKIQQLSEKLKIIKPLLEIEIGDGEGEWNYYTLYTPNRP